MTQNKFKRIAKAYEKFMLELGLNLNDPNTKETPNRVAKMYIEDIFSGIYKDEPKITTFPNIDGYDGIVFQGNIEVKSVCSHHHCPFIGKAFVAYIPSKDGVIIGLSKLNRIVDWIARRPQVQENLTMQIHDFLNKKIINNQGIAIYIEAEHTCVSLRGIKQDSKMKTAKLSGKFFDDPKTREEFYNFIKLK